MDNLSSDFDFKPVVKSQTKMVECLDNLLQKKPTLCDEILPFEKYRYKTNIQDILLDPVTWELQINVHTKKLKKFRKNKKIHDLEEKLKQVMKQCW